MSGVNKVIILGRLGAEPELRSTPNGYQVCTLSVATSETFMKDNRKEEKTEWHRVVLWGRQAELAGKFLRKGRMVYLEGKLQTRSWQDPQGQKRYATEIIAHSIQFVDGGNRDGAGAPMDEAPAHEGNDSYNNNGGYEAPAANNGRNMPLDDDIPF